MLDMEYLVLSSWWLRLSCFVSTLFQRFGLTTCSVVVLYYYTDTHTSFQMISLLKDPSGEVNLNLASVTQSMTKDILRAPTGGKSGGAVVNLTVPENTPNNMTPVSTSLRNIYTYTHVYTIGVCVCMS